MASSGGGVDSEALQRLSGELVAVSRAFCARGWALATLDFTIKMTGLAKGEKLKGAPPKSKKPSAKPSTKPRTSHGK